MDVEMEEIGERERVFLASLLFHFFFAHTRLSVSYTGLPLAVAPPAPRPIPLGIPQEVLQNHVLSFTSLQDALNLRSSHRQLHNDGYDSYRYSHLEDDELSRQVDVERTAHAGIDSGRLEHLRAQDHTLLNSFRNVNKLEALLQNKTLSSSYLAWLAPKYLSRITGNGENDSPSVALLVNDCRFSPSPNMYYHALRQDQVAVARALEQDDFIRSRIASNICVSCSENVACYKCCNGREGCVNFDEEELSSSARQQEESNLPEQYIGIMYCRSCVRAANLSCIACDNCVCPQCFEGNNYFSCMECSATICNRWWCKDSLLYKCCTNIEDCRRAICEACLPQTQERQWHRVTTVIGGETEKVICCGGGECCGEFCTTERETGDGFEWL